MMKAVSDSPEIWPLRYIPMPRSTSVLALAGVFAVHVLLACYWQLLFARQPHWFPPAIWLWHATDGALNVTFTTNVVNQLIIIVAFLVGVCRFRPTEFGLNLAKVPAAACLTALLWAASHVVLVFILALIRQPIVLNPEWTTADWTRAVGQWIGQLFGNTPFEEVVYRGFLLPQCVLLMMSWMPAARSGMQIAIALFLSQGLFALSHGLTNMHQPPGQWLLLFQFVMGLGFAGVYLRTGNLFLTMGLHSLANNPSPLLKEPYEGPGLGGSIIMLGTLLAVCVGLPVIGVGRRWMNGSKQAPPTDDGRHRGP